MAKIWWQWRRRGDAPCSAASIAFIPQAPMTALNPVRTIGAQFDEHLARLGQRSRKERREHALAMLAAARLPRGDELLAQYPHQLSGGMCQRVLIALAFASNPRLVIADEPTTALDVTMHAPILRLIADMQREHGTAVIFITHDLRLAAQLCDDVIVMYAGRAVESGPARAVLSTPAHPYTRCLQLANPSMSAERRALYVMPEQMPSLRQLQDMTGCHFAPRCPLATDECRRSEPPNVGDCAPAMSRLASMSAAPRASTRPRDFGASPQTSDRRVLEVQRLSKIYRIGRGLLGGGAHGDCGQGRLVYHLPRTSLSPWSAKAAAARARSPSCWSDSNSRRAGGSCFNGEDMTDPALRERARQRRKPADGVSGSAIGAQSAPPRRQHRHPGDGSRQPSCDLGRAARARRGAAGGGRAMRRDFAARLPGQLSGGQRQRINIARALCNIPKVLVADEIVSGLDVSIQAQLLNLLARLRDELGFAMLFISHDLSVVRHLCSRVLVMYRGEIVEQGPIDNVFADPQHPHTRALLSSVPPDEPGANVAAAAGKR